MEKTGKRYKSILGPGLHPKQDHTPKSTLEDISKWLLKAKCLTRLLLRSSIWIVPISLKIKGKKGNKAVFTLPRVELILKDIKEGELFK